MPTCLLIRHGRTTFNANGTLAGWSEGVGLDDTGRRQASDLADRLRGMPVRAVVSSPLQRCVETAQILVAALEDLPLQTDERVGECRYGAWTGGSLKELARDPLWRLVQDQPSAARFPDGNMFAGESIAEMQARALQAVREIDARVRAEHGSQALWALVSHGDVIKSILADAAGAHLDHFQRFLVSPASLSVVSYTGRRPFVVRLNDGGPAVTALVPQLFEEPITGAHDDPALTEDALTGDALTGDALTGDAPVGGGAGSSD